MNFTRRRHLAVMLLALVAPAVAGADPMTREQLYTLPTPGKVIPDDLIGMLRRAAARPDVETRLETLDAIARHRIAALADVVRPLLDDDREVVRLAAVRAAAELDLKDTADRLEQLLRDAPSKNPAQRDLIHRLDRTLAGWAAVDLTDHWLDRLGNPTRTALLRASAAESLGRVHPADPPAEVAEALRAAAVDVDNPVNVRLAAAAAAKPSPAAQPAAVDLMNGSMLDRLVGLRMLGPSPSPGAVAALRANAEFREPAVQAASLRRLVDLGPDAAPLDLLRRLIDSSDPHVRRIVVEGARLHRAPAAVAFAFARLNDPHPDVRAAATDSLVDLAETADLAAAIRDRLASSIANHDKFDAAGQHRRWAEAEQLARLAHRLDHKPAAVALVGFYDHARTEVAIAAVNAVRDLRVAPTRPPTVALMVDLIERTEARVDQPPPEDDDALARDVRRSALRSELARATAVALGAWAEPAASPVLQRIIPKQHPIGTDVRAAGIWALGRIHAGRPDDAPVRPLISRMNDNRGMEPEADVVRRHSAIALGRMQARSALGALRQRYESPVESLDIRAAARWAISRITGESPPALTVEPHQPRDTFITPHER